MKKILVFILILTFVGCVPVVQVNLQRRHHVYDYLGRAHFYTAPVWIPGRGVVLQEHYIPRKQRQIPGRRSRN